MPDDDGFTHDWQRGMRSGSWVLICDKCGRVWWPDMTKQEAERKPCPNK